ncbi:MAG: biotin-dependent carboxyltransferase family protein [Blastocatellia bacterium]|nr:biotin-dependent carboxyltransferase family protein [Blastocatellia bacterium]
MSIRIEKAGLAASVQDLGRVGHRSLGIGPGGVMDRAAAELINILLGNERDAAVVEMHFPACDVVFENDALFAIGGADFGAELDGEKVGRWRVLRATADSKLCFEERVKGARVYLSVRGGLDADEWLGSRSTNFAAELGGVSGRFLRDRDVIKFAGEADGEFRKSMVISRSLLPIYSSFPTVRITSGSEMDRLTSDGRAAFLETPFDLTNDSNRLGFRLKGEPLSIDGEVEILSSAVAAGTIQLLPDGQLVVLMADHQTTGGYPRLGHVASVDLPLMAQLAPGDKVGFHLISVEQAEDLAMERELELNKLEAACKFAW